jgi:hypothetical protein
MSMATTLVNLVEVKDPDQSVGGDWKFAWTRNTVGLWNALIHRSTTEPAQGSCRVSIQLPSPLETRTATNAACPISARVLPCGLRAGADG